MVKLRLGTICRSHWCDEKESVQPQADPKDLGMSTVAISDTIKIEIAQMTFQILWNQAKATGKTSGTMSFSMVPDSFPGP